MKKTLGICAVAFFMLSSAFCAGEEQKEEKNEFPEAYLSEAYLSDISIFQGIDETVNAVESLGEKERLQVYDKYFELADEYEAKAGNDKKGEASGKTLSPEDREKYLLISVNCFEIISRGSLEELKQGAQRGLKRCREKLLNIKSAEFEDKNVILQRCIDLDLDHNSKSKGAKIREYFARAKEYEEKADRATDAGSQKNNIKSALDFYGMVNSFADDEELRKRANEARGRLVQKLSAFPGY